MTARGILIAARLAVVVLVALLAVPAIATAAVTNAVWGSASPVLMAPGATHVQLRSVSCGSPGECSAVGTYDDSSGAQGLLVGEHGGSWAHGMTPVLPAGAASSPHAWLNAVSCAGAGSCSAVGGYTDSAGNTQGLLLTETGGSWAAGEKVTLPANGQSSQGQPSVDLDAVSCHSAGDCTAVGHYADASGADHGLLVTQTAGVWAAGVDAPLPPGIAPTPPPYPAYGSTLNLASVSCTGPGDCSAVGYASDRSGTLYGLLLTQTGGAWGPADTPGPGSAVSSVSCSAPGDCSAVGGSGDGAGLLLTQSNGTWAPGVRAVLPPAGTPPVPMTPVGLSTVACSAPGLCSVAGTTGQYRPTLCCRKSGQGLVLGQIDGGWGPGVTAMLPADAAGNIENDTFWPGPVLGTVACGSAGTCTAGGTYQTDRTQPFNFSFDALPLLVNQTRNAWGSGFAPALPADAAGTSTRNDGISAVSCPAPGRCAAVGDYLDGSGDTRGMVLDSSPGTATSTLSLTAPDGGTMGTPIAPPAVTATIRSQAGPTGEITYRVSGPSPSSPSDCSTAGQSLGATSVSGVGSYGPPNAYTPPSVGTYWWYASYAGDENADPAVAVCGPGMSRTVVTPPAPGVPPDSGQLPTGSPSGLTPPAPCPPPSGRLSATAIGPLRLGMSRTGAHERLTDHHASSRQLDRFCFTGGGQTRVLYASAGLIHGLPIRTRRALAGRIVVVMTANPHYSVDGVRPGTRLATARRRLKLDHIRAVRGAWFVIVERHSAALLRIQRSRVAEIGIADPRLAVTPAQRRRLVRSL